MMRTKGNRKSRTGGSETEYVVVCQVADGIPAYEVKDEAGDVKTTPQLAVSCNHPMEANMPLGAGMSISEGNVIRSTLVEHTSLG